MFVRVEAIKVILKSSPFYEGNVLVGKTVFAMFGLALENIVAQEN